MPRKQPKQVLFEEPTDPFIIKTNHNELAVQRAVEALTADISKRMGITLSQATVVVKCSDYRRQFRSKGIPEYLTQQK